MKRNTPKKHKNLLLVSVAILLLAGSAFLAYNYLQSRQKSSQPQQTNGVTPPTEQQKKQQAQVDAQQKEAYNDAQTNQAQQPAPTPSSSDSISMTALKDGASIIVQTKLKGFAAGTCDLTVTNGSQSYKANADIIYQPEYSTCAGFSVPVSAVGSGTWSILLKATPEGGAPLQRTITFEVK